MSAIEKNSYFQDRFLEDLSEAGVVVTQTQTVSATLLQRKLNIGYAKAARLLDALEEMKAVGPLKKNGPRDVLMTRDKWDEKFNELSQAIRTFAGRFSMEEIDNRMTDAGFAKFCGDLLRKNGFTVIAPTAEDSGADLIAEKDGVRCAVCCKNQSEPVENAAIRDAFFGKTIHNCHVACVLTNNTFTPAAEELANQALVLLWDRAKLIELMKAADLAE